MRSKSVALLVVLASAFFFQGCMLHHSASNVRSALLKRNTGRHEVQVVEAYVKKKGWHWEQDPWNGQYRSFKSSGAEAAGGGSTNVVSKAMGAYLGDYGVLPVSQWEVGGYWLFDAKNELIDIYISKRLISL